MKYTIEDYRKDLRNPEMEHIKSRERFEAFYTMLGSEPVQKKQNVVMNRFSFIEPKGNIIELGCHVGFNLIHLANQGFNVTGVDVSQTLLDEATDRVSKLPKDVADRITLKKSFIEDLDEGTKYDTIILTETLEHCIDPKPVVEKAHNLLADDGSIFISAPSTRTGTYSHVRGISKDYLRRLLAKCGLKEEYINLKGGETFCKCKKTTK